MKKLTKKIIRDKDFYLTNVMTNDDLDNEVAVAWHPALGMLVGEWMNIMINYAITRDRKLFFGVNSFGMPSCFFDASNKRELAKLIKEQKEINRTQFMNPRKVN